MNTENNNQVTSSTNQQDTQQGASSEASGVQKISTNPNPRANENIGDGPFEPTATGSGNPADEVGTEITDGEDA